MNEKIYTLFGILLPFLGTSIGAGAVFLLKTGTKDCIRKALLGFASGVMIAASIWSLLLPALDLSQEMGKLSILPVCGGFICGILFLLLLDVIIPHLHPDAEKPEGRKSALNRDLMLMLAVTLHNFPEGMAVGVTFAGYLSSDCNIALSSAMALSLGIALQNLPEGAIISMPLAGSGTSKPKAFIYGVLSGIVEPVGALLTLLLTAFAETLLPFLLSFAAGAMIYVVTEELIPQSHEGEHTNLSTLGVAFGFAVMMTMDVTLG